MEESGDVNFDQLAPATRGPAAGARRADAFADLSDALANTDANTDSQRGLRRRRAGSAGTAPVPALPATARAARHGRRRGHCVRASAGGVAGRAASAARRKRHCLRPRRALHCG